MNDRLRTRHFSVIVLHPGFSLWARAKQEKRSEGWLPVGSKKAQAFKESKGCLWRFIIGPFSREQNTGTLDG